MDLISIGLSRKYTDQEVTKIINQSTPLDAMSRQAAVDANGVDKVNLKQRLDDDYNEIKTDTDTLKSDTETLKTEYDALKKLGIHVGTSSPTNDSIFWLDESVE